MSNSTQFFNWPWPWSKSKNSPLNAQLITNPPQDLEIELSSYQQLPSLSDSDSESPSHFLSGRETLKPDPIPDLDIFFGRLYDYYCEKGLYCIITKWIIEILNVVFMVCFIGFFLLFVDWRALTNMKCGMDAVELGEKPCDLGKVIKKNPLVPITGTKLVVVGSMVLLTLYGFFNFLKFFVQFKNTLRVRRFYYNSLHVTDREIQTTPWPRILSKVVRLQRTQKLCVVKDLTEHEIIMRVMRKENFLIGMLNKGILGFPISYWVPGTAPAGKKSRSGTRKNFLILPKTLEWTLNWCIFQSMFDSKFCVQKDFTTNPLILKRRLIIVGILMLLLSPCLVIFMLVYLFLKHAEQFYNHPSTASSRRWSNLSKWILREFNEVEHLFKHRLNNSAVHATNYLKQFPSPLISIIAKFISFVSGGFAAILIIIAFLDESLLEGHIFGRNLIWYAAVFGTVTAVSRAAVSDDPQVLDSEGAMSLTVQQTHYMPKRWRGKENSEMVFKEFESLFQYTGMMLLEEMASILITPYLLIFVVPKRVDDILRFVSDFTVYVEGVGDVCSLSLFDFEKHGNKNYASPFDAPKDMRSSQGKMEKSFLSFQSTYQSWEPGPHGQIFLSNLRKFKDSQSNNNQNNNSNNNNNNQNSGAHNRYASSTDQPNIPPIGYNLGSLWVPDLAQKTHPYLLDWYYTSKWAPPDEPVQRAGTGTGTGLSFRGGLTSQTQTLYEIEEEIEEDIEWEPPERMGSHLEASTSSAIFKDNKGYERVIGGNANDWWRERTGTVPAQQTGPGTSFIEPPGFGTDGTSFIEPARFGTNDYSDPVRSTGPGTSFIEPPNFNPVRSTGPGTSFIEPTRLQSTGPGTSFIEPPRFGTDNYFDPAQSTGPGTSFIEPTRFGAGGYFDRYGFSRHSEEREGVERESELGFGCWMAKTAYMAESEVREGEEELGLGLHFTDDDGTRRSGSTRDSIGDAIGTPLVSLPVRIIPSSSDPV
ncbi:hypothetical protein LUZ60_002427 [Juncus effusus]|nr:hypothetical protein LUZ60_002427 [Juncus effusus]